jgi:RNA polymerase sigma-70 factor (ECF subfamily)
MSKQSLDSNDMLESSEDFAAAYESHSKRIYQFLYWRTQDSALSEDLTSSVFEKAWRSRRSFHGGSVQAWLYRIARNSLTDHWRSKKAIAVDDIDSLAEATTDDHVDAAIDASLQAEQLKKALSKLPKTMRTIVELRFIKNQSARQVAEQLNITENNVRIIQYRALRKLRTYLK